MAAPRLWVVQASLVRKGSLSPERSIRTSTVRCGRYSMPSCPGIAPRKTSQPSASDSDDANGVIRISQYACLIIRRSGIAVSKIKAGASHIDGARGYTVAGDLPAKDCSRRKATQL